MDRLKLYFVPLAAIAVLLLWWLLIRPMIEDGSLDEPAPAAADKKTAAPAEQAATTGDPASPGEAAPSPSSP